jgi:hypothetical protein
MNKENSASTRAQWGMGANVYWFNLIVDLSFLLFIYLFIYLGFPVFVYTITYNNT